MPFTSGKMIGFLEVKDIWWCLNRYVDDFTELLRYLVRISANGNFKLKFMSTYSKYCSKYFPWIFSPMDYS